jgi:hypothetical protein
MILDIKTPYETSVTYVDAHRHKYDSAIAEYVDMKGLHDTSSGDTEAPNGAFTLVGKRIITTDDQGFVYTTRYPSKESARQVYDALDFHFCEWAADEEDIEDEWDASNRDWHINRADLFVQYVIRCADENLEAFSFDAWLSNNAPEGPLG